MGNMFWFIFSLQCFDYYYNNVMKNLHCSVAAHFFEKILWINFEYGWYLTD